MLFGIGLLVFLIWLTQWLFGLIPVILGRAYINYIIQLLLNLIPISALTIGTIKEVKKKKI
jgi:thiamine transporter ThiT